MRASAPQIDSFDDAARQHILEVLRATNGVVAGPKGAAVRLGLKRTTLLSKMEKLGIAREDIGAWHGGRVSGTPVSSFVM